MEDNTQREKSHGKFYISRRTRYNIKRFVKYGILILIAVAISVYASIKLG
jgi:hypothetical protein